MCKMFGHGLLTCARVSGKTLVTNLRKCSKFSTQVTFPDVSDVTTSTLSWLLITWSCTLFTYITFEAKQAMFSFAEIAIRFRLYYHT